MRRLNFPSFDDLMNPVLKALGQLGGRASIREIDLVVLDSLNLPEAVTATLHASHRNTRRTELQYRLTWARTFLKEGRTIGTVVTRNMVLNAEGAIGATSLQRGSRRSLAVTSSALLPQWIARNGDDDDPVIDCWVVTWHCVAATLGRPAGRRRFAQYAIPLPFRAVAPPEDRSRAISLCTTGAATRR